MKCDVICLGPQFFQRIWFDSELLTSLWPPINRFIHTFTNGCIHHFIDFHIFVVFHFWDKENIIRHMFWWIRNIQEEVEMRIVEEKRRKFQKEIKRKERKFKFTIPLTGLPLVVFMYELFNEMCWRISHQRTFGHHDGWRIRGKNSYPEKQEDQIQWSSYRRLASF